MRRALALGTVVLLTTATFPVQADPGVPATPTDPVSVVAVGDIACQTDWSAYNGGNGRGSNCRQKYTAQAAASVNPDEVLILGDAQYETGQLSQFRKVFGTTFGSRFLNRSDPTANRLWAVPGNHDYGDDQTDDEKADGFWAYFNGGTQAKPKKSGVAGGTHRGWYRRESGSWSILALNANCEYVKCGTSSAQYKWLKKQLQDRGTATCTLAYWHQPLFTNGKEQPANYTRPWWRLLDRYGAELVLNGHDHTYQRYTPMNASGKADPDGIAQFIAGAGGHSLTKLINRSGQPNYAAATSNTTGVLHLELGDGSYQWEYVRAPYPGNGNFTDTGQAQCR